MEDDAELVRRALARDQQAFAALYDRYADKLFDYARRQTGHSSDAGDIVQDTFVLAIQRLHQLREPSLVRPWLYAIARSEVHRRHRRVNRLQFSEPDEQAAMSSGAPTADDLVHQQELRVLFAEAANGLDPSDREVLDLHMRHSMSSAEIAAALGIPERQVGVVVQRVRERLGRSIGVVLLAKTPKCPDLVELQRIEGTPLTVLSRKRLARHIEGCLTCGQQLSDRMRPETLLAALPIAIAPSFLRNGVLQRMAEAAHLAAPTSAGAANNPQAGPSPNNGSSQSAAATPSQSDSTQPPQPGRVGRTLPQREGTRVWQTTDGFPRLVSPTRRIALIVGATAAVAVLLIFGILVVTGGDSNKRLTAGSTTIDGRAVLDDATLPTNATVVTAAKPDGSSTSEGTTTSDASTSTSTSSTSSSTSTSTATTLPGVLSTTPVVTSPPTITPTNPPVTNPPPTAPPTTAPDTTAPVFQSANASPHDISAYYSGFDGATCPDYPLSAAISANVTDDRGVASVSLHYTIGSNSYNTSLSKAGNTWQVTIGPIATEQFPSSNAAYQVDAQFTATDTSGNSRVFNVNNIAVLHDCIVIT